MTREEMLQRLALSQSDLHDLLRKARRFLESLNEEQREALRRSFPTAEAAARTLGPDVTAEDLQEFLRDSGSHNFDDGGTFMMNAAFTLKNPE